jgi:hypothetical protein
MPGKRGITVVLGLLIVLAGSFGSSAERVTLDSLLDEMVNLAALAESPAPRFTCKQFSSYDRKSKTADDHDGWFANHDRGQYLRVEEREGRKEFVMMDAEGPGCVVRIWSANAGGDLRVYIDGNEMPALEMNMQHAMDGQHEPFLAPLAGVHSRGWNLYFPIPYSKRCKVTTTAGDIYYHVNYRTYPAGTAVENFSMAKLDGVWETVTEVRRILAAPDRNLIPPPGATIKRIKLTTLAPGATKTVAEINGPAAVCELQALVAPDDWRRTLRHTILEIAFDGQPQPAVVCPLGDFFGQGPGINAYQSLPLTVLRSGDMRSRWFMPFRKSCKVTLANRGKTPVDVEASLTTVPYKWTDRSMYFHAKWRAENRMATRPFRDWTILKCSGQGTFVGCMLSVANPVRQWWGEGDEKIYVDGEEFPSHFGTGTEDYFGYAWCCPDVFTHAYHNQPRCDGPGNYGLTTVNRLHILDQIPFAREFLFDMEVWHWHQTAKVSYNATAYWYARPGGSDFYKPLIDEMLEVVEPDPWPLPKKVKGALEGESLKIVQKAGEPQVQSGFEEIWSDGKQLWWIGSEPGDVLVVEFPVAEAGKYAVLGNFTKAIDYGICQLFINDQKAGKPMDFFNDGVVATGEVKLGTFDLKKGDNLLKVEITGKNDKALAKYMFGLDYLLLKKAK